MRNAAGPCCDGKGHRFAHQATVLGLGPGTVPERRAFGYGSTMFNIGLQGQSGQDPQGYVATR